MSKRGIVVAPLINEAGEGRISMRRAPLQLLYQYFVYWNEVVAVDLPYKYGARGLLLEEGLEESIEVAAEEGLYRIEDPGMPGGKSPNNPNLNPAVQFWKAQQEVFRYLNREKEGYWTVSQSVDLLVPPGKEAVTRGAVTSALQGALPVPSEDVSIGEILKFRDDREAERLAFWAAYEGLYRDVIESEERHLALQQAVEELESALDDVRRAMEEGGLNPVQMSLDGLWRIPAEAVKTAAVAHAFGAPVLVELTVGAVQAAVSMNAEEVREPADLPGNIRDYAYLGQVDRELRDK